MPTSSMTTDSGLLLVTAVAIPSVAVFAGLALGGRSARRVTLLALPFGLGVAIAVAGVLARSGTPLVYLLGTWAPPLGVALRADALSAVMMLLVALVICSIAIYAYA